MNQATDAIKSAVRVAHNRPRVRADVTLSEFWWTVAAVFLIGAVFGWGAFGHLPFPKEAIADTSLGEFIAACGTWIIGYGAWKYARASHQHQLDESSKADRKRIEADVLRVGLAINKIGLATGVLGAMQTLDEREYKVSHGGAHYAIARCQRRLNRMILSDSEREALSDEHLKTLRVFEHAVETAIARMDSLSLVLKKTSEERVDDDIIRSLKSTYGRVSELKESSDEFIKQLSKHRRRLKAWADSPVTVGHS